MLGKNKDDTVRIKFVLKTVPEESWTTLFNNRAATIYSVANTTTLILQDTAQNISQRDIVKAVQSLIVAVDEELHSDRAKNEVMARLLRKGSIVAHDSLSYDSGQYEQFLNKINSNQIL